VTAQLAEYFAGDRRDFDLPMHADGDALQRQVWALLAAIPYGSTRTYGRLAEVLGCTAQEVGAAVGSNPLSILVGCHRVVGTGGKLTGYAGGLARKRHLLDLESGQQVLEAG
jgi:methylated-DNA-[protein]-cysteine S-methyltransferase